MSNLIERLFLSTMVILALVLLLVFSDLLFVHILITVVIALLSATALWEFAQLARAKGWNLPVPVLMAMGALISASFSMPTELPLLLFLLSVFLLFALHFRKIPNAIVDLSLSVFGMLYIAIPLGMVLSLLHQPHGLFWVTYLIAVTKSADIAGYIGGTLFGDKKLAPQISPSKTVVGALCGLASSLAMSVLLSLSGLLTSLEAVALGIVLGVVSIFSDLSESLFKRDAGKKDSNHLPGLGGVLDLLDSLLFTIPLLYLYTRL